MTNFDTQGDEQRGSIRPLNRHYVRMKTYFLLLLLIAGALTSLHAQQNATEKKDSLDGLVGLYQPDIDPSLRLNIKKDKGQLILEIPGQGQVGLVNLGNDKFRPDPISPPVTLTFLRDSTGKAQKLRWQQEHKNQHGEWIKPSSSAGSDNSNAYTGRYRLKNNPYKVFWVREDSGHLTSQLNQGPPLELFPLAPDKFRLNSGDYTIWYDFVKDRQGHIRNIETREGGSLELNRIQDPAGSGSQGQAGFHREKGFDRADSIRGMLTPLRTCYDVLFYALDIAVEPETKSIRGNATIRFKAVQSFDRMQVDLYANLKIEKILFHKEELAFTREFNAVYITFPAPVQKGQEEAVTFLYSGKPQLPDIATLKGGFIWFQDKDGAPWIESVCQGSGASLWWPCKDHLSDKPDSMKISITVPDSLMDISNGRLLDTMSLPGRKTRFDWYVDYPINNYDVVVNIGNYKHFSDIYVRGQDTMKLHYYCIPYNFEKAQRIFARVKPMLALYEKDFGEYPFRKDGFTIMESLYPMEHQGAVSIGSINNPVLSNKTDLDDLARTTWHESAHEWWGNSITCKDMADLWIHEAFATYAEVLACEFFSGKKAARKYLNEQHPENKEPIIGTFDVNDFHLGDMYPKGCLMLNTLRNTIDNDSLWFALLRGLQDRFRYQTVTTNDIVRYFNLTTQKDYTTFFDQYLRHAGIPELALVVKTEGNSLEINYKWNADVEGFHMPVKITTAKNSFAFISPASEWKTIRLLNMTPQDLKVDTEDFYVKVKIQ